uniref:CCHC-type domain-containing protein n=1 Tax=Strongyloides papillosus TaxID=174720 RepID=A0A0N5C078_STREA
LELVASQIDHDVLRKMRQGFGENLLTFNNRFYTKMLEVYPDNGRKLSEEVGNQNTTFNSTELRERSQIYNCYMAAIRKDIADKIPYIEGTGKCLKFAMNKAIGIEINMKDVQALRRNEGQYGKRSSRRFVKTYEVRKEENSSLICYNCNVKGHIIKNCSRPLTTCKYCNKKGHLLKHCRGKKFQNNSRSSYGGWKQNLTNIAIITTLAAICASVGAEETAEPREKWYKPPFVGDFMIQAVLREKIMNMIPDIKDAEEIEIRLDSHFKLRKEKQKQQEETREAQSSNAEEIRNEALPEDTAVEERTSEEIEGRETQNQEIRRAIAKTPLGNLMTNEILYLMARGKKKNEESWNTMKGTTSKEKDVESLLTTATETQKENENKINEDGMETKEQIFEDSVKKIAEIAKDFNESKLEPMKEEIERALKNIDGLDVLKVFSLTLIAFLEVMIKKKGWKVIMKSVFLRII